MTGRDSGLPRGEHARDTEVLIGRAAEQAAITAVLERALTGTPQVVLVEGDAGVGKSALARSIAAAMPSPSDVLWARGDELERQLDFGIVDQLLREAAAAGLPSPPTVRRAGARPDPLAVGEVILGLVEEHGQDRPLLVVVDDAQWADLVSVQALAARGVDPPAPRQLEQPDQAAGLRPRHARRALAGPMPPAKLAELYFLRRGRLVFRFVPDGACWDDLEFDKEIDGCKRVQV